MNKRVDKCVKCGEPKKNGNYECSNCGVIYSKAEAAIAKKNIEEQEKEEVEKELTPSSVSFQYVEREGGKTKRTINSACRFKYDGIDYIYGRCAPSGEHPPDNWQRENQLPISSKNMTMCKACGRKISKNAETCPGCGEPQKKTAAQPPPLVGKTRQGFGVGCLGLIGFLFLISLLFPNFHEDKPKTRTPEQDQQYYARRIAEDIVTSALKSPSTADFPSGSTEIYHLPSGIWKAKGVVDAQNGFGAMIRSTWYIELSAIEPCSDYALFACWTINEGPLIFSR